MCFFKKDIVWLCCLFQRERERDRERARERERERARAHAKQRKKSSFYQLRVATQRRMVLS